MLCRKFRQTLFTKPSLKSNVQYKYLITSRSLSKKCIFFDSFLSYKPYSRVKMSSIRLVWRDLVVARLWGAWTRSYIVNTVVKRCRRERSVREVFQCFRQTILRPRRTFLLSATAAFKSRGEEEEPPPSCEHSITDEDLEALVSELEQVEQLCRSTLYCTSCGKRLVVEKRQPAVRYCACKEPRPVEEAPGGWVPYMEAEDVIIWRKEYKPGLGLFAYKVYGRYKEVRAADFAAVQVDGAYRRVWDAAVASLSVVERSANGLGDQAVLHWEVLWPRLFANRDYVYIRRHKEFEVRSRAPVAVSEPEPEPEHEPEREPLRPSVHARAKRIAQEADARERRRGPVSDNKAFIIISRSCTHPSAPETKHAIRVSEYWSHMVVRSIDGPAEPGMEFVLTYYDEPAVGGLPAGVAAWATGRAAPAYLARMRAAAARYRAWAAARAAQELPDFLPFGPAQQEPEAMQLQLAVREQDMESSKHGPDLDNGSEPSREQTEADAEQKQDKDNTPPAADNASPTTDNSQPAIDNTQPAIDNIQPTIDRAQPAIDNATAVQSTDEQKSEEPTKDTVQIVTEVNAQSPADSISKKEEPVSDTEPEKSEEEESSANGSWWRYLYPFYYFV